MTINSLLDGKEKLNDLSLLSNRDLLKLDDLDDISGSLILDTLFGCGKDENKLDPVGGDIVKELVPIDDAVGKSIGHLNGCVKEEFWKVLVAENDVFELAGDKEPEE